MFNDGQIMRELTYKNVVDIFRSITLGRIGNNVVMIVLKYQGTRLQMRIL